MSAEIIEAVKRRFDSNTHGAAYVGTGGRFYWQEAPGGVNPGKTGAYVVAKLRVEKVLRGFATTPGFTQPRIEYYKLTLNVHTPYNGDIASAATIADDLIDWFDCCDLGALPHTSQVRCKWLPAGEPSIKSAAVECPVAFSIVRWRTGTAIA